MSKMVFQILISGGMLIFFCRTVHSIQCFQCTGASCVSGSCEGDFCFVSEFLPSWGRAEFGKFEYTKGCVTRLNLPLNLTSGDFCHVSVPPDKEYSLKERIQSCLCNSSDYCNSQKHFDVVKTRKRQVTCLCDGASCKAKLCRGDYCSIVRNIRTNFTLRGCVTNAPQLLMDSGVNSCFRPPLGVATGIFGAEFDTSQDMLSVESCICRDNFCNLEPHYWLPVKPQKNKTSFHKNVCRLRLTATFKHKTDKSSARLTCEGDLCYKTRFNITGNEIFRGYQASGCMNFVKQAHIPNVSRGSCLIVSSPSFKILHCLTSPHVVHYVRQAYKSPPDNDFGMTKSGGLLTTVSYSRQKDSGIINQEQAGSGDDKNEDELSNTEKVGYFILAAFIIFCVLIVWKMNLPEKFSRARYQSVA